MSILHRNLLILALLCPLFILGSSRVLASPQTLYFQGLLLDEEDVPLNGEEVIYFSLYDELSGGELVWSEAQTLVIEQGHLAAYLGVGDGPPLTPELFTRHDLYLEIEVDGQEPSSERIPFASVAYAFTAQNVESLPSSYGQSINFTSGNNVYTGESLTVIRVESQRFDLQGQNDASQLTTASTIETGFIDGDPGAENSYLSFSTRLQGSLEERLRLTPEGRLGVGTTYPKGRIDAAGTSGLDALVLRFDDTGGFGMGPGTGTGVGSIFGIYDRNVGAIRMAIDPTGKVGIGTSSPIRPVHILGTEVLIDGSAGETSLNLRNTGDGGKAWLIRSTSDSSGHGGGKLVFDIAGVAMATLTADGKLGIGTTSPTRPLHVAGGEALISGSSGETSLILSNSGSGGLPWRVRSTSAASGHGAGKLVFDLNGVAVGTFASNGSFGIGTTSPTRPLHVKGKGVLIEGGEPEIDLTIKNGSTGGQSWLLRSTGSGSGHGTGKLVFDIAGVAKAALTSDGKMGIGTSSPSHTLQVVGDAAATRFCLSGSCISSWPGGGSGSDGDDGDWVVNGSNMYAGPSGRVGIGTSVPERKLHVIGHAEIEGSGGNAGAVLNVISTENEDHAKAIYAKGISKGSNSMAIMGEQTNPNPDARGGTFGVLGRINRTSGSGEGYHSSAGIFGDAFGPDTNGDGKPEPFDSLANGVQGETWSTNNAAAGGRFFAAATTGTADGVWSQTGSSQAGSYSMFGAGPTGSTGYKSAVVFLPQRGPTEFYAMESTEVWFEDVGEVALIDGYAKVDLATLFLQAVTINDEHPYQVFLQPYGDIEVYAVRHGRSFEIIAKGGAEVNAQVGYRIMAKRRFHETRRLTRVPVAIDRFMRPDLTEGERARLNQELGLPQAGAPVGHTVGGGPR